MCGAAGPRPARRLFVDGGDSGGDCGIFEEEVWGVEGLDQWWSMGFRTASCLAWVGVVVFMWIEEPEP